MNDEQFEDLKQFIDSRISQSESRFDNKIESLKIEIEELRQEFRAASR